MNRVLVPAPIRPDMHPALLERFKNNVGALEDVDVWWDKRPWVKDYEGENYSRRAALGRQATIDDSLKSHHEWALWIDPDITFRPDLLWRLLATSERGIVAPLTLIEGKQVHYDTAGVRPSFQQHSSPEPPPSGIYEMFSVGCCVLVPAEVHRRVRFQQQDDDDMTENTEWTSLCVGAKERGYPILWNTEIVVEHADLPAYGEQWHMRRPEYGMYGR
jgi:GT2 family glycosyltransferase